MSDTPQWPIQRAIADLMGADVEALVRRARNDALEEAAIIAHELHSPSTAAAIRALKDKP